MSGQISTDHLSFIPNPVQFASPVLRTAIEENVTTGILHTLAGLMIVDVRARQNHDDTTDLGVVHFEQLMNLRHMTSFLTAIDLLPHIHLGQQKSHRLGILDPQIRTDLYQARGQKRGTNISHDYVWKGIFGDDMGDYCDVYLTHDSMSVRKAHNSGKNHLRNVVDYYQQIGHEKAQSVIDSITSSYAAEGQAGANPMLGQHPGPGQPFPPPPFGFPGGMPPPFPLPGQAPGGLGGFPPPTPGRGMPPFPFPPQAGTPGMPPMLPNGMPFPPPGGLPPNFQFPPPGFPIPPPGQGGMGGLNQSPMQGGFGGPPGGGPPGYGGGGGGEDRR
ncbi:MAG: hypothetical protein MMC33_010294 [Icmadophila ericetorum]|nr:hypothetical protein [Icmadophila ericetorum]